MNLKLCWGAIILTRRGGAAWRGPGVNKHINVRRSGPDELTLGDVVENVGPVNYINGPERVEMGPFGIFFAAK